MTEQRLNFTDLPSLRMPCSQTDLAIIGGTIEEQDLAAWLQKWNFQSLPWRLWEEVSVLRLEKDAALPTDFSLVERGRCFGAGGDLTFRRDGRSFGWRFIGLKTVNIPMTPDARSYWDEHPDVILHRVEQQAILWGAWKNELNRWHDNRVGWARLEYPPEFHGQNNVYVHYSEYLEMGRVAFVWLHDLGKRLPDKLLGEIE